MQGSQMGEVRCETGCEWWNLLHVVVGGFHMTGGYCLPPRMKLRFTHFGDKEREEKQDGPWGQ